MSNLLTSTSAAGPGGSKPGSGGGTPKGQTPAEDVGGLKGGPKSKQRPSMGGNATLAELRGALTRRKQVDYQGQFFSDAKTLFDVSRINDISNKMSASDLTGGETRLVWQEPMLQ